MQCLPLNVFLASACIAYFGAFTASYRLKLVEKWKGLLVAKGLDCPKEFSLVSNLATPMQVAVCALARLCCGE